MSRNFSTPKGNLQTTYAESCPEPKMETMSKASEGSLKSNFEETSDLHSPFFDEIANPSKKAY
jgi:hypothetical protein